MKSKETLKRMARMKRDRSVLMKVLWGALVACLVATTGCVSKKIEPLYVPPVTVSMDGEGMVTLSWDSLPGYNYRLVAVDLDDNGNVMKTELARDVHRGTGEPIVVRFKSDRTTRTLPEYSVRPEKIVR